MMTKQAFKLGALVCILVFGVVVPVHAMPFAEGGTTTIEAVIEPAQWSELQFLVSGCVTEIPIAIGDTVTVGDILMQVDDRHAALAVQQAEAALATAQANLTVAQAGPRAQEITEAQAMLDAAKGDLWQAVALRDQLAAGSAEASLAAAQAQLDAARAERRMAQQALQWANEGHDNDRKQAAQEQVRVAEAKVLAAEARVSAVPAASAAQLQQANAGAWLAQAQVAVAEAQLALLEAGPQAMEVKIAEIEMQQLEVALAAARLAQTRTTLYAPFAGTVTQVYVEPGDTVAPGVLVVKLADLEHLRLKTTDLTELDVVHVREGQHLNVKVDALPEEAMIGVATSIALEPGVHHGDVVYTVVLDFVEEVDPRLRWGMTGSVEIILP